MKKIVMIIAVLGLTATAYAQGPGRQRPQRPNAEEMIAKATEDLNLTDEQVAQWEAIHKKYESSSKKDGRKAMGEELEATLTEEQLVVFKKMRENQKPPRGGRN
ncbi:conotoxin [Reichenbachiella carrageenanivorans]|uniref:Conotoxin n=1 Tax=Reichenbachiella carrageenanivorans TaxID=2979869 RepID=A0ABY6CZ59_9BACT|nr:conotoxin [Reichenbachiella carrageenanivorans]UXX79197.1 conotoxin [Reichenbachiella carrageenanivorans]